MRTVGDLAPDQRDRLLAGEGLALQTGPFLCRVRSTMPAVADGIGTLYRDYPSPNTAPFADYHVRLRRAGGPRRWWRPQAIFEHDGFAPFRPLPADQALPFLEWGLNWCIAANAHQYLIVHAAALERDGRALLVPGQPGAGKSTFCAALAHRGWRLLSDEMAIIGLDDGLVRGLARPINLKNESIAILRNFLDDSVFSPTVHDTTKGSVALLRAPSEAVARVGEPARPAWIVAPRYRPEAEAELAARGKAETCFDLASHGFNYSLHGARGFGLLADLVDACDCYRFTYSALEDAVAVFADLAP